MDILFCWVFNLINHRHFIALKNNIAYEKGTLSRSCFRPFLINLRIDRVDFKRGHNILFNRILFKEMFLIQLLFKSYLWPQNNYHSWADIDFFLYKIYPLVVLEEKINPV